MSINSGDFNTPTTSSSSIDSEEFTTPLTIMENKDNDDVNITDVPEPVSDPTARMTLEDLAQLMVNGFADVNAKIDRLNRSTEDDKEITDSRIDNLILANRQLNDDVKVIQVRQLMMDGYVHLVDNKVEEIKNINYQSNQYEALVEHDDITITGKVMFTNEYTGGLLIALAISERDAVVANITTKNLLTNIHATDIKLNDIIRINKFMAERAKTLDELGLSNEMFGPDFNPEMYLSQETNTADDDVREYKLIRILSFKQEFRSAEEAIKVIGQNVKNLTRDLTALKSSVKQIMDDKTETTINALDKDRRSSVQTRVSLVEENKDKGFKAKRTTMLNQLIQNQMVNGEVVATKDISKDDDSEEEDNPFKVLQALRDRQHQLLIGNSKTRTGLSNSLDIATIEQITSRIFEEHSKFKGEVSKTNIPPGLIQVISKALNEDKIYYPKSTNKITLADIKFFYNAWMFGDKPTSIGNSGIPNNTLVIKHPMSQESINQLRAFFPVTLAISNPKNLNSIVAFIRHLQTLKNVEVSVIQVVPDEALRALIAKNESRKDPKGKVILEKCGIITSKTHFHTFMSTGINSNPITNAANSLTFDDILDMWIYSIQITSKDSFANILFQALQYNRSQEHFREGLYLESVLYYKEIYERLNKHVYDFSALFKVLMTYVDPNFVPPTVIQVPSIQTDNVHPNAKVVLLDLLSVFIKSFTIPNYLIRVYQDMDDQFKTDIRSCSKDIIDVLNEFTKKSLEHLQVSEKALLMTRTLANASDSAAQFFATHRGTTSKIATAPTANPVTRPPYVKPSTNAIAPATSQKITSYFPSSKQSLRYMHGPMSHAPISGSRHEAEYDSEGWYGPDPFVISTAQDYIMNTTPSIYDVNDPFHSQNYSQTTSEIARTVDPNHLAYVMHLSNLKPFTAFEKNKTQNKGPCFNYFSDKGCHLKECQFSHLPQDMVKYYDNKIKEVQQKMSTHKLSVIQNSQDIDHLSISNSLNVDGREKGEEGQGDVAVNEIDTGQQQQQLPTTDTQHQAADHADLYKFFDKLSNEQQAQILNHVKHDLERRAGSTMYQQGFVAGRLV